MKNFLMLIFAWWYRQTWGTWATTWWNGEFMGEDELGNRYYRTKGGRKSKALGYDKRWVVYADYAEGSAVPPSWHGWLHHTVDTPPTKIDYTPRAWQKPHLVNPTGTPAALRPPGSTLASGRRPKATGDYEAWVPGQ